MTNEPADLDRANPGAGDDTRGDVGRNDGAKAAARRSSYNGREGAGHRDSITSVQSAPEQGRTPRRVIRMKHHPRHRCPSLNGSLTSNVRPPRYSQDNGAPATPSPRRRSSAGRRLRLGGLFKSAPVVSSPPRAESTSSGVGSSAGGLDDSFRSIDLSIGSDDGSECWPPLEVVFNETMEIYVFET